MRGAYNLVVLPALPIAILPGSVLLGDHSEAVGETINVFSEKLKAVKELAHALPPLRLQPSQPDQFVSASPRRRAKGLRWTSARRRRGGHRGACNSPT